MKNTNETVHHSCNSCEMFAQFDVSFSDLYLLHTLPVFYHVWKNYKIGFEEKCGGGGGGLDCFKKLCIYIGH